MANYADRKWKDEFYVLAYRLARQGLSEEKIAKHLGVTYHVLRRWKESKEAFGKALEDGQQYDHKSEEETFLYNRLPAEIRDLWDRIRGVEEKDGEEVEVARDKRRMRMILDHEIQHVGMRARQRLFIHALLCSSYNYSEAYRLTGIAQSTVSNWKTKDPEFRELCLQAQICKKDMVEGALMELVREKEPAAVIFANKTLNRERGYNDRVDHMVTISDQHSVESLGLTLEMQKELLAKIRTAETKGLPAPEMVEDAEFFVKEKEIVE